MSDSITTADGAVPGREAGWHPHAVSLKILIVVWVTLLALTYATVAITRFDLGPLNLWLALGIAALKAGLVALYFMHLRYDNPFNGLVFVATLLFILLFIGLVLVDTSAYREEIPDVPAPAVTR